ncbi:MAG: helix-hairpin-helix domain-containing protein [Saprospirales bacterium]|nr:helix-hairpin-helix domain-containing protein [Saprospirales bacterium]
MMKKIAFLSFSRRERYGSSLLICSFLLLCALPEFLPLLFPPAPLPTDLFVEQKLVHFTLPDSGRQEADTLFFFDPNEADVPTLILLGIPEKTAETIERYRQKGGKFRKKEDFSKIYSLAEADYLRLEPFIRIAAASPPSYPDKERVSYQPAKTISTAPIDINSATQEEWQTLRGIGPGFAGRIVKFREKLGGFSSVAQVGETFGLPDSVFRKIEPQLLHSPVYRFLQVNTATEEELAAHPYLSDRQARTLVLFRNNHGPFAGQEDFARIRAIPDSTLQKLIPYISYETPE